MSSSIPRPTPALDAFRLLREGNARFVSNVRSIEALASRGDRESHAQGQCPMAIVLSCSDSRVPSEFVFDYQLRHGSALLEQRIAANQLRVVGAEYSLDTGRVDFFDTTGLDV